MFENFKTRVQDIRETISAYLPGNRQLMTIEDDDDYYDDQTNPNIFTSPRSPQRTQRAVMIEQTEETEEVTHTIYSTGMGDKFKEKSIMIAGAFGSYVIAAVLGYGNGFFFADFRTIDLFHFDWWVWMSYLAGFLLEFIAINILFKSSKYWFEKNYKGFAGTFAIVLVFALGTIVTQYLMMQHQLVAQGIVITDNEVAQIPILNLIVGLGGLHGAAGFLIFRAALFHLGEIACIFLVPTRKPDLKETIQAKMEENRQYAELRYQENFNRLQTHVSGALDKMLTKAIDDIEQHGGIPMRVPELQAQPTVIRQEPTPTPRPVQRTLPEQHNTQPRSTPIQTRPATPNRDEQDDIRLTQTPTVPMTQAPTDIIDISLDKPQQPQRPLQEPTQLNSRRARA